MTAAPAPSGLLPPPPVRAGARAGGYVLSASLILTTVASVAKDFDATHIYNPAWPPHAVFHDVAMLNLLTGFCGVALWLLWRRSREPHIAALVAWLAPVIFWSAFFWVSLVIPGASLQAMPNEPPPSFEGLPIYPNAALAFVLITLSTGGLALWRRAERRATSQALNRPQGEAS